MACRSGTLCNHTSSRRLANELVQCRAIADGCSHYPSRTRARNPAAFDQRRATSEVQTVTQSRN